MNDLKKKDLLVSPTRRSLMSYALKGGVAAGFANMTIMKDLYAQSSGPIVIGHHAEITGGFASWGHWHDICAKKAVDLINAGGGIAKRKVELPKSKDRISSAGAAESINRSRPVMPASSSPEPT